MIKAKMGIVNFIATLVCVIVLAIAVVSITFNHVINYNTKQISTNIFTALDATHSINKTVNKMQSSLVSFKHSQKPGKIDSATIELHGNVAQGGNIVGWNKNVENSFLILEQTYVSNKEIYKDFKGTINQIIAEQNALLCYLEEHKEEFAALQPASNDLIKRVVGWVDNTLIPLYEQMEKDTVLIEADINANMKIGRKVSRSFFIANAIFMCSFAVGLVCLIIVFRKMIAKKIRDKDIYYREFLFKVLSENIDDVFLIYNFNVKKIEYFSKNMFRILGLNETLLMANIKYFFENCIGVDALEIENAIVNAKLEGRLSKNSEYRDPSNGNVKSFQLTAYPINEDGNIHRCIIMVADLTDTKNTQAALKDALASAQNANKAKSEFLSKMSHEIRTPMNAIIGMTTIASNSINKEEKVKECLDKIAISSKHMLGLINDILDVAKIESGKVVLAYETFYIKDFIDDVVAIIQPQAESKNITFNSKIKVVNSSFKGDFLRLKQIALNILSNSIKFTNDGGEIGFDIEEFESKVEGVSKIKMLFSDTGIGMSKEFLKRIFEPFSQEISGSGGTGLGMSITKNTVELMEGTIEVESQLGEGAKFVVEVNLERDKQNNVAKEKHEISDLKVLVLDDDVSNCEHTQIILERMGVSVVCTNIINEALDLIKEHANAFDAFDVAYVDYNLPGQSGVEVAKKIRNLVGDKIAIVISAYDWRDIEVEARDANVNSFITKPYFQSSIYNSLVNVVKTTRVSVSDELNNKVLEGKRVLIAEDNELNMEITVSFVSEVGVLVECAVNGKEAVEKFVNSKDDYYDLILMDVQMPIMNGYEATKKIRNCAHVNAKTIPIIAMTANAFAQDVEMSFKAGMNAHITKPIDINVLVDTMSTEIKNRRK